MSAAKYRLRGYNGGMVLRRTPHAVYDTLYHKHRANDQDTRSRMLPTFRTRAVVCYGAP